MKMIHFNIIYFLRLIIYWISKCMFILSKYCKKYFYYLLHINYKCIVCKRLHCPTKLRLTKISERAKLPTRGSEGSAGLDLYSSENVKIPSRGRGLVPTDIQIALPDFCYARIAPRSSLALKHGIDVGGGVIDKDYRGNILIILFNHSDTPYLVKAGQRVAQLILERIYVSDIEEKQSLNETQRGKGGFGSTGIF